MELRLKKKPAEPSEKKPAAFSASTEEQIHTLELIARANAALLKAKKVRRQWQEYKAA